MIISIKIRLMKDTIFTLFNITAKSNRIVFTFSIEKNKQLKKD